MRVLQLGPYPPPHGGVQSNLVAIRTFLRRHNVSCTVINITRHRKPDSDEVYYPKSAAGLIQLLLRLDYDIIHLHVGGMLSPRLLSLALVCTLIRNSKAVMTFHSGGYPSSDEGKSTTRNSLAGFVLRRFDGLIGVNPEIISFFQRLGVAPSRIRLIYPHSFLPEEDSARPVPEPLASFFSKHNPVLISVGLLEPEYDLPLQINVLGQVRQKFPCTGLLLIGSGSLEQDLRGRIGACAYAEHILLCGDVPHNITTTAISRADLMLRTTLFDGDAVSVREALHLGTPVIASDNGMRPAGVHLIPKSNLPALLRAIEENLAQPLRGQADRGIDESNVRAVFDFYRELTGEKCA
ncbi:MAG: glycosyltransferase family 4 protein [Candidatus Sulfotelmatobacter sp.]